MVRELTTKRFLRGCWARGEFHARKALGAYPVDGQKIAESRVLEPFKKLFQ
jgi:hypothetical protein